MSDIEAGELHSKLSRPNLIDSLNLLFKTTFKHSRLQISFISLVNCNELMKLGFDQWLSYRKNLNPLEPIALQIRYMDEKAFSTDISNFVDTMKNDDEKNDIVGLY